MKRAKAPWNITSHLPSYPTRASFAGKYLPLLKARARLELREVATEQDAKDVVEIMKFRSAHSQHICW